MGHSFEMEARGSNAYQDGVVVLNLAMNQATRVWLVHRNGHTNEILGEIDLGELAPGAKMLQVVSGLFDYVHGAKYSFETRDPNKTIQVMGLVFAGGDFFSPAPVYKK